ncbi:hypothetical protein [Nocardiopsis coralliicola]
MAAAWVVVVEESTGGYRGRFVADPSEGTVYGSREEAMEAAHALAYSHFPPHPSSERRRTVVRRADDSFLVVCRGMLETHFFRVEVGELV